MEINLIVKFYLAHGLVQFGSLRIFFTFLLFQTGQHVVLLPLLSARF